VTDLDATAEGLARFPARGPCTDAERRAANWLHDRLRAAGHEAWVETYWVRPQWALSLALHATVGVVASVVAISAPLPALVAAAVAALSLALEVAGYPGLLRLAFPRRATQYVLTTAGEDGGAAPGAAPAPVTLLIAARYDAPRGGLVSRLALGRRLRPSPRAWVAIALLLVAACAGLRSLDLEGLWLGVLQFLPTVALLGALAAAGDAAVSPVADGDVAAPAVAVALHDELSRHPPEALSPALLLYGAGEGGPAALRAHLRRDRPDRSRTVVLEVGAGGGPLAFATAHRELRGAAERAGEAARMPLRAASGAGAARSRRLPALWIGGGDPEALLGYALATVDAVDAELR
jgi:hypothetical protein